MSEDFTFTELRQHWDEASKREPEYRTKEEAIILEQMFSAYCELKKLGWQEIIYCPKDGSSFLAVDAASTSAFVCNYTGEWPKGSWWAYCHGDMWPSRPILWKRLKIKNK